MKIMGNSITLNNVGSNFFTYVSETVFVNRVIKIKPIFGILL